MADKEQYEIDKLKAEIELLQLQLDNERIKGSQKPESFVQRAEKRLKNWLPLILSTIAVLAGLWGIFEPVANYVRERQREYEITWNKDMINYVDQLSDPNPLKVDQAIIMLTAFELDALPILLLKLERTDPGTNNEVDLVLRALNIIKDKKRVDDAEFAGQILKTARDFFTRGRMKTIEEMPNKVYGSVNYIKLLGELGKEKQTEIEALFDGIETALEAEPIDVNYKTEIVEELAFSRELLRK